MLRVQAQQLVVLQAVTGNESLQAYAHALHYLCYFWHRVAALLFSDIHEGELLFTLVHNFMSCVGSISPQSYLGGFGKFVCHLISMLEWVVKSLRSLVLHQRMLKYRRSQMA